MLTVLLKTTTPTRVVVSDSSKLETNFLTKLRTFVKYPLMLNEWSMISKMSAGHSFLAEMQNMSF